MSKKSRKQSRSRPPRPAPKPAGGEPKRKPANLVDRIRASPLGLEGLLAAVAVIAIAAFLMIRQQSAPAISQPATVTPTTVSAEIPLPATSQPAAGVPTALPGEKATPAMTIDVSKTYVARIDTDKGQIVAELYPQDAPITVNNFVALARSEFYNNLTFHRVEPGFVIQGGDPKGDGTGGPGYTLPAEIKRNHPEGALAMARLGDQVNPQRRSSGSQFYITLAPTPNLDGGYTVFGQVTQGMDVVKAITRGDKIKQITIEEK